MTHDTNFIAELRTAFANLTALINARVEELDTDVDNQMAIIANAYGEIKADRAELGEIGEVVYGFASDMLNTSEDTENSADDAQNMLDDMYDLVMDGYIEDEDVEIVTDYTDAVEEAELVEDEDTRCPASEVEEG